MRRWQLEGPARPFRAQSHAAYEIAWVEAGGIHYTIGRRRFDVAPGQAFVVPVGTEHATTLAAGARAGSVWLDAALLTDVGATLRRRAGSDPWLVEDASRIASLGRMMQREAQEAAHGDVLAVEALGDALAVECLRGERSAPPSEARVPDDPRIAAVVARIEASYAEPLSIDELARAAGLSRFHFTRLFTAQLGASPYRFVLDTRLARAAELLRGGRCSVTEAALTVGFTDLGRFGRAFRRVFGASPSRFAGASRRSAA